MKPHFFLSGPAALAAAGLFFTPLAAHAGHVYAGLTDTNGNGTLDPGDALSFVGNTTGAVVTGPSQGVQTMSQASVGAQSGLYLTSNISYTSLGATSKVWSGDGSNSSGAYMAANPFAAKTGSFIVLQIASVTGPQGASFSFWDNAVNPNGPTTTFTIGTGVTLGTGAFNLTNPALIVGDGSTLLAANPNTGTAYSYASYAPATDGLPGGFTWNDANYPGATAAVADPYGHIHGRSMTVDQPGAYTVSYVLHDLNGLQQDSAPFVVSYNAVVPEPGVSALLATAGGLFFVAYRRRRLRRNAS